ncbi:hypothetical protein EDD15DRAFT_2262737 [Pisolithus albus]|nr:hypothetical protein EDD15DRAFT_2262737 [Pisolithus albus]
MSQLAKQERRSTRARRELDTEMIMTEFEEREESVPLTKHYHLSHSFHNAVSLPAFLNDHSGDPAIKDFIPNLKDHLLARLRRLEYDGDEWIFASDERHSVQFVNLNHVSMPKQLQVNFTTYDIRCDKDTLHSGQGDTIMMYSREQGTDAHPFWYAQLIRAWVFCIYYEGEEHDMDVVWVRWLGVEPRYQWGIGKARLPKVGFILDSESGAFGFVDPALVIRACHLIPVFTEGRTDSLLRRGPSLACPNDEVDDWASYYVNIFADRDLFVRFSHVGVGHEAQYPFLGKMSEEDISADFEEETLQVPDNKGPPREYEANTMDDAVGPLNDSDDEDDDGSGDCTDLESSLDEDGSDRDSNSEGDNGDAYDLIL